MQESGRSVTEAVRLSPGLVWRDSHEFRSGDLPRWRRKDPTSTRSFPEFMSSRFSASCPCRFSRRCFQMGEGASAVRLPSFAELRRSEPPRHCRLDADSSIVHGSCALRAFRSARRRLRSHHTLVRRASRWLRFALRSFVTALRGVRSACPSLGCAHLGFVARLRRLRIALRKARTSNPPSLSQMRAP